MNEVIVKTGKSSWYCRTGVSQCHHAYPSGMYAAAGRELQTGNWRGRRVRACSGSRCVTVTLIDTCGCPGSRIIDLYSDAFASLAPLSRGVIPISVRWTNEKRADPKVHPLGGLPEAILRHRVAHL